MKKILIFILLVEVFLHSTSASEHIVDLNTLFQLSNAIILGKVTESRQNLNDKHVWTNYEIKVTEYLKGSGENSILVAVPGGVSGKYTTRVAGVKQFVVGNHYCMFLWYDQNQKPQLLGFTQGAIDAKYMSDKDDDPVLQLRNHPSFKKSVQKSNNRGSGRAFLDKLSTNSKWSQFKSYFLTHD